jgi:hypothetical protein
MTTKKLSHKKCRECGKDILVAEHWPHPLGHEATGNALTRWDADKQEWVFSGWYCEPCGTALIEANDCYDWS